LKSVSLTLSEEKNIHLTGSGCTLRGFRDGSRFGSGHGATLREEERAVIEPERK